MNFSPAQNKAIHTSGSSLLVSAAAGSGKTAVLVQRVIEKLLAGGDISRLWIMTFTNAAAAEMRQKIENAIAERLEAEPDNVHLQQQALLLPSANISTVHAACKRILEQNFQILGLDPSISIGDESQLDIMFEHTLEDLVEKLYVRACSQEDIKELIAFFSGGRDDRKLLNVLRDAYHYYEGEPFPQTVFKTEEDLFDNFKADALYESVLSKLQEATDQYAQILDIPEAAEIADTTLYRAISTERDDVCLALSSLKNRNFDGASAAIENISFASWNTRGKAYVGFEQILERAQVKRLYAKNLITALKKNVFHKSAKCHMDEISTSNRILTTLFAVIAELDESFTVAKRERGFISFSDMERLALRLVVQEYDLKNDSLTPTPLARHMAAEIDEIIVDEYQDTNRKQDLIFRALSKDGENIFMVGDVKQSIYRFRAACPELFLEKRRTSVPVGDSVHIQCPSYLYLNQNFRSHPTILSFVNQIFATSMNNALGQIDYDSSEQLYSGNIYPPESRGHVEFDVIFSDNDPDEEFPLTAIEKEACLVAEKIQKLHGTPFYDVKRKVKRPLEYGDMAILCRVTGGVTGHFETALRRQGIHTINNNQDQQFLDVWEVKMLRAFLQVISNPYRDIPLITLMYSDFYGFSASQLASIRTANKKVSFFDAVRRYAQEDAKCAAFLEEVEQLRRSAVGSRTDEILQMIFARTNILEKVAAYPDGKTKVANMKLMLRYASAYEQDSYKGLFAYLNYLDKMSALGKILPGAKQGEIPENCVQLLSIHKSKGLEYPVCFVVNISKSYRDQDVDTFIAHRTLGPAVKMREDVTFTEFTSLPYELIKETGRRESLSEEMRILYVALTRPKTHLYLICSKKRAEMAELLGEVDAYQGSSPAEFLSQKPSALKWILFALRGQEGLRNLYGALELPFSARQGECDFVTEVYSDISKYTENKPLERSTSDDMTPAFDLIRAQYPYREQTQLPIKLSVSEVKGMRDKDPEALPLIPEYFGRKRPTFLKERISGNIVGNAVHKFMQFANFKELGSEQGFEKESQRLLEQEFLTRREIELVSPQEIQNFINQPIFQDILTADIIETEKRFFCSLPACRIYPESDVQESILLQGVMDCYYEKNGQLCIVDYKTDRLKNAADFVQRYSVQLKLYRYALTTMTGKKADKLYIYSFYLNEVIEIS